MTVFNLARTGDGGIAYARDLSIGLIAILLPFFWRDFNWQENIALLILVLGSALFRLPFLSGKPREAVPRVEYMLMFFVIWKIWATRPGAAVTYSIAILFAVAVVCGLPGRERRKGLERQPRVESRLAALLAVGFIISVYALLYPLTGMKYGARVSIIRLIVIAALFAGTVVLSSSWSGNNRSSQYSFAAWAAALLAIVGLNVGLGFRVNSTTRRAETQNRTGNCREAIALYREADVLNDRLRLPGVRVGRLMAEARGEERAGYPGRALAYYEEAVLSGLKDPEGLVRIGDLYLENGNEEKALEMYLQASRHSAGRSGTGKQIFRRLAGLKHYGPAVDQLDRIGSERVIELGGADQYAAIARILQDRGELEAARSYYQRALLEDGANGRINYMLGLIYRKSGRREEAQEHFLLALEADPPVTLAHFHLGRLYEEDDWLAAIREYRSLLAGHPNHLDGLHNLEALLGKTGNDDEAASLRNRISRLSPARTVNANLENQVVFIGYELDPPTLRRGEEFTLKCFWKPVGDMTDDYRVYVHFDNALHSRARLQYDHDPACPTSAWVPGCVVREERKNSVPGDAPPGRYFLRIGMYRAGKDNINLRPLNGLNQLDWRLATNDKTFRVRAGTVRIE